MLPNAGQPVTNVPECYGIDIGKFSEKEEWSGETKTNTQRQHKCGTCPLSLSCVLIHILEKMK